MALVTVVLSALACAAHPPTPDDCQRADHQDGEREAEPAPGKRSGRGQARRQQRAGTAYCRGEQQPQDAGLQAFPAARHCHEAPMPKTRVAWRRASVAASARLITNVPGWPAVQASAVARPVKWST
jgi:hypothetical protein